MATVYKALFEVRLLHEYFLTQPKGETIFDWADPQDRLDFLTKQFQKGQSTINAVLAYRIPDALSATMQNHHLRLIPTYSGFKVMIQVIPVFTATGVVRYQPAFPLPPGLDIIVKLDKASGLFDTITNAVANHPMPSLFYFSNSNGMGSGTFPLLTNPVDPLDAAHDYRQGELASFGPGDIRQFFSNDAGSQWRQLKGDGFVSNNDRLLLPQQFEYRFPASGNVTNARFTLMDPDGTEVQSVAFSGSPLAKATLDFRQLPLRTLPQPTNNPGIGYTLEVTGNNGFSKTHRLVFMGDGLADARTWGMVHIRPSATNADFSVLDAEGFLKTHKEPGSAIVGMPVFEIRLTSSFTYWRYRNDKGKKLKLTAATSHFLVDKNGRLLTKSPRPATAGMTFFKKQTDNSFHYLPNPVSGEMLHAEQNQLISEIFVAPSNLFPLA